MKDTTVNTFVRGCACLAAVLVTHVAMADTSSDTFVLLGMHSLTGQCFVVNVEHRLLDMSKQPEQAAVQRLVIKGLTFREEQPERESGGQVTLSYDMESMSLDIGPAGLDGKSALSRGAKASGKFSAGSGYFSDRSAFEFNLAPGAKVADEAVDLERSLGTALRFMALVFPSSSSTGLVRRSSWQTGPESSNGYRFTLSDIEKNADASTAVVTIEREVNGKYFEAGYALVDKQGLAKLWMQQGMGIDNQWKYWGLTVLRKNIADTLRTKNEQEFKSGGRWWEATKKKIQRLAESKRQRGRSSQSGSQESN